MHRISVEFSDIGVALVALDSERQRLAHQRTEAEQGIRMLEQRLHTYKVRDAALLATIQQLLTGNNIIVEMP